MSNGSERDLMNQEFELPEGLDPDPAFSSIDAPPLLLEGSPSWQPIDWTNLQIQERQDEEGRVQIMSQEEMYDILGLTLEEERENAANKAREDAAERDAAATTRASNADATAEGADLAVEDRRPEDLMVAYDMNNPQMTLGTLYPNMKEFRLALRQYALKREFAIGIRKTDKSRHRAYCKAAGCPWRIVGHLQDDKHTIKVTVLVDEHDCYSTSRIQTNTPSLNWVAQRAVGILRLNPKMGTKELQVKLQDDYNVTIAYDTVWRGQDRALKQIYGGWEESFHMLYSWKEEAMKRSPGSVIEIDTIEKNGRVYFNRFFCALRSCIDGFQAGCRPYLSIDSTALNGRWNGHLASATGVDGHNWMYPVAFGFFDSETEDNWSWFMAQLKKALGDPPLLAVCTDACKGLEKAVRNVFPRAEQRECFYHLMKNFNKKYHGSPFAKMWSAAWTYRRQVFEEYMAEIFQQPGVFEYLRDHHNLKWTRCAFNPAIKCDYVTNNVAEVFNNWVKDIKDLPIVDLADKIREMIMLLFQKRQRNAARLQGKILPAVMLQLKARSRGLGHLRVLASSNWNAEVQDNSGNHSRHVVKATLRECTCMEWQHTGKPCEHALAFLTTQMHKNIDLQDFVDDYYSLDKFKAAYAEAIEGMPDKKQWPKVDLGFVLAAPLAKRAVGRQRKLRIKGCLEGGSSKAPSTAKDGEKKKTMIRGPVTCQRCHEKGHRQSSYKCPLNGTKKRNRKPRHNSTKYGPPQAEPATPERPVAETIMETSPGIVTKRKLAILMGEGTSSQSASSPVKKTPTKGLHRRN